MSFQPKPPTISPFADKFNSENLVTLKAPGDEFAKKAIEQLQFRSLCLKNTMEYAEFDEKTSAEGEKLTLDLIAKTFSLSSFESFFETSHKNEPSKKYDETDFFTEFNTKSLFQSATTPNETVQICLDDPKWPKKSQSLGELEELLLTQMTSESSAIEGGNIEGPTNPSINIPSSDNTEFNQPLRTELEKLVLIIISNIGKNNSKVLETRKLYQHNELLLQAYDALVQKYFLSKKVKEDIVRYIIRKMMKTMKKPLKESENIKGKKASLLLCKRYFPGHFDSANNVDPNKEKELLGILMPYNQNSKNRTMNSNFVKEIFSSEPFLQDYQEFLFHIDFYLQEDNKKRLKKLLDLLMKCVKSNNFESIGSLKVFPWLDTWIEETRKAAFELLENKSLVPRKQVKLY